MQKMDGSADSLRERAFLALARVVTRFDPGRLEAWVELGLTMTQLRVLFLLWTEDGASAGALAERLSVTPSTLTRIVDRLVRQGLVRREPDEDDRRLVRHSLTESGLTTIQELERRGRARMDEVFDGLSASQLERLVPALEDLSEALEALEAKEAAELSKVEA
jgi:DNA-binding MarR family transcriptional regulator